MGDAEASSTKLVAGKAGLPRVLITDPIDPEAAARLGAAAEVVLLGEDESLLSAARCAAVIIVRRQIPVEALAAARRLRALVRHGAGLDFIPVAGASAQGVAVVNTPGVNATSVAEAAIGLILAGSRRIAVKDRRIRQGAWSELRGPAFGERELAGRRLGLVGFGAVGKAIARIAHFGFGMQVAASRLRPGPGPEHVTMLPFRDLLATSDIIVVACPLSPETRGLIGRAELAAMRPGAGIVNVARGAIVYETALVDALASGHLAFAGLDVLEHQPPAMDDPLLACDAAILSPHTAGITAEAVARMSALAVEETMRVLAWERPVNLVNAGSWAQIEQRWRRLSSR